MLLPLPLLPLGRPANAALSYDRTDGLLLLRAAVPLPAGMPLCASPGGFAHAALMRRQGTPGVSVSASALPAPPAEAALVPLVLSVPPTDALFELKQARLPLAAGGCSA